MGTMTIEESLQAQLSRSSRITAIVGSRLWQGRLPRNSFPTGTTPPALTFWRVARRGFIPLPVKRGGHARPRFQLDCWAKTDTGVGALRDAVLAELQGFQGLLGGSGGITVSDITLENCYDVFERKTGIYHVALDFFIFHGEETQA